MEIAPAHDGIVARVFVRDRDVVSTGQELLEVARGAERFTVRSPAPGIVSRCRVRVGDAAEVSTSLLSIIRADDVLVVARFEASAGAALRNGSFASVRISRATAQPLAATLVCVAGPHPWGARSARLEDASVRVVARLQSAPPAGLWPGIEASVDVQCEA